MVRTLTVCAIVFIPSFIVLQFESVICLVLNYYTEVSANIFSDAEHMYFQNVFFPFKVRQSMHHHTFEINQPTRCNNFSSLLLDVYVRLNMFQASSIFRSSTTAVAASGFTVGAWWSGRPRPTALLPPRSNGKTRGCYCS
jgi:hypothetical protein